MTKKSELDPLWTFFLEVSIQKLIQFVLLFNIWLVFTRIMCPITPFFMYMHRGPKKVTQTFLLYRWQYTLIMCYIISLCHVSILCKHTCVLVCLLMCVYVSCACIHTCVFRCLILSWNFDGRRVCVLGKVSILPLPLCDMWLSYSLRNQGQGFEKPQGLR